MDTTVETTEYKGCTIRIAGMEYSHDLSPREKGMALICRIAAVTTHDDPRGRGWGGTGHLADDWADTIQRNWYGEGNFSIECEACGGTGESDRYKVGLHTPPTKLRTFDTEDEAVAFVGTLDGVNDGIYYVEPEGCEACDGDGEREVGLIEYVKHYEKAVAVVPLRYSDYGSSGCQIHACDEEDANLVAYTTPDELEECGTPLNSDGTPQDLTGAIEQEVETYEKWLNGDVYFWETIDPDGETIDAVHGYIGDDEWDYMRSEGRASIDAWCDEQERERIEREHWASRDVETVPA